MQGIRNLSFRSPRIAAEPPFGRTPDRCAFLRAESNDHMVRERGFDMDAGVSRLKVKFLVSFLSLLVLFSGVFLWLNLRTHSALMFESGRERAELLVETAKKGIIAIMLEGKGREVQNLIETFAAHGEVASIRILGVDGRILHSARREEIGGFDRPALARHRSEGPARVFTDVRDGRTIFHILTPIYNQPKCHACHGSNHEIRGILSVEASMDKWDAEIARMEKTLLLSSVVLIVLVLAAGAGIHTRIVDRPMGRLLGTIRKVHDGDLSARVAIQTKDEFGIVGSAFNSMVGEVERTRRDLEEYHYKQMERADRLASIGELASSIAHEIKNPLAGISGAIQILSKREGNPPPEILDEIQEQVVRVDRTVKNLLSYGRPASPRLVWTNARDVLERSLFLVRHVAERNRVHVETRYDDLDLPIFVDPEQMHQVFLNISLNAIQAMPHGGVLEVSTAVKRYDERNLGEVAVTDLDAERPEWVEIRFQDNGVGIPSESLGQIFEPFFTTRAQGTGLGLSICRQILRLHQGMIAVSSEPGRGSCFTVFLPVPDRTSEGSRNAHA